MNMKKYIRDNKVISGKLQDNIVMMGIGKGKHLSLNPIASYIWDILKEPYELEPLCEKLLKI